jgi:hypothetical protein
MDDGPGAGALTLGVTMGGLISGSSACRGGNGDTPGYGRGDSTLIVPDECCGVAPGAPGAPDAPPS